MKHFKKSEKSRLLLGQENYKKSRCQTKKIIAERNRIYLETKILENIGKPKELWKTLKSFGFPYKVSIATTNASKKQRSSQI